MQSLREVLQERLDGINVDGMEAASKEQRHTEEGSIERAYWHHGYAMALRDTLLLLDSSHQPN